MVGAPAVCTRPPQSSLLGELRPDPSALATRGLVRQHPPDEQNGRIQVAEPEMAEGGETIDVMEPQSQPQAGIGSREERLRSLAPTVIVFEGTGGHEAGHRPQ
jgi:hypothetical protein